MNEWEWERSNDPAAMLDEVMHNLAFRCLSERQLRFFCAACCRRHWRRLGPVARKCVVAVEDWADGIIGVGPMEEACWAVEATLGVEEVVEDMVALCAVRSERFNEVLQGFVAWAMLHAGDGGGEVIADIMRDVAGPGWHDGWKDGSARSQLLLGWCEECVSCGCKGGLPCNACIGIPRCDDVLAEAVDIARRVYQEARYDGVALKVLADALEEAGCRGSAVGHLREESAHVRGCWAVDLVLGKP